eukprot:jgi/Bigna1/129947/aug1.10_g4655
MQVALCPNSCDWSVEPSYTKSTSYSVTNSKVVLLYIVRRIGKKGNGDKVYLAFAFADKHEDITSQQNTLSQSLKFGKEESKSTQWVNVVAFEEDEATMFKRYLEVLLNAVASNGSQIHCFTQLCQDDILAIASKLDNADLHDYIKSNIHSSFPSFSNGLQNVHDNTIKLRLPYRFYFDLLQMKSDIQKDVNDNKLMGESFVEFFESRDEKKKSDELKEETEQSSTNTNIHKFKVTDRMMAHMNNRRDRTVMRVCNVIHVMQTAFTRL